MDGLYGIDVLKTFFQAIGDTLSIVWAVFVEHKGLWQLIGLQAPMKVLTTMDFQKAWAETKDMSDAERMELETGFKASMPAAMSAKVGPFLQFGEKVVAFVEKVVSFGMKSWADVQLLVAEFKMLFGLSA